MIAVPMPHRTAKQVIKRRLVGTEGNERIKVLRDALAELPDYRNGPYADLRKWVTDQIEESRVRKKAVHRDSLAVRREGAAQVALVGAAERGEVVAPAGALGDPDQDGRLRVHDAAAGSGADADPRRARAARRDPGAHRGRGEDRGGGRALLGVLRERRRDRPVPRGAGAARDARGDPAASSPRPGSRSAALVAVTKLDEADASRVDELARASGLAGGRGVGARRREPRRSPRRRSGS